MSIYEHLLQFFGDTLGMWVIKAQSTRIKEILKLPPGHIIAWRVWKGNTKAHPLRLISRYQTVTVSWEKYFIIILEQNRTSMSLLGLSLLVWWKYFRLLHPQQYYWLWFHLVKKYSRLPYNSKNCKHMLSKIFLISSFLAQMISQGNYGCPIKWLVHFC